MTGENVGIFNSVAEIEESDNRYALKDIDSEAGNRKDGEDDQDSTDVLILMNAGKVRVHIVSLTLLIWALIILTVWFIQKFILQKKMDKYDKWKGGWKAGHRPGRGCNRKTHLCRVHGWQKVPADQAGT